MFSIVSSICASLCFYINIKAYIIKVWAIWYWNNITLLATKSSELHLSNRAMKVYSAANNSTY